MADIASDRAVDPDAQAAVTDFLDYTEYLPSDLIRSLTLIRGLDERYLDDVDSVNELTKIYGSLPSMTPAARPDVYEMRSQISTHLDHALNARESAYAEACRMFDVVDRHQNRLKSIIAKLHAIPKPPSRDPSPQPQQASTQPKRSRSGRKLENGPSTRLTLIPPRANTVASALLKRPRGRRVTVPGEVMPPYDPDSPLASTEVSDWESPPPSPPRPVLKFKQPKPPAHVLHAIEKPTPAAEKARLARETTESYRKPTPPPEDAEIGSKYKPWTHLTEYEMYRLRKKMKKNHAWEPSDVMIRRELADRGRGWENYYRAKAEAQANGTPFIDIDSVERLGPKVEKGDKLEKVETVENPEQTENAEIGERRDESGKEPEKEQKSEAGPVVGAVPPPSATPAPKPKAAKKSESRKDKKLDPARSQAALAAQEAELAARRLGDIGSKFRTLFTTPFASALASLSRSAASTPTTNGTVSVGKKAADKTGRKRKAEDTPALSTSPSAEPDVARKKQKIAPKPSPLALSPVEVVPSAPTSAGSEPARTSAGTIKIPLKLTVSAAGSQPSKTPTPAPATRAGSVQLTLVAPKTESTPPASSRPPSRRSTAASVEPQPARFSQRTSTTPSVAGQRLAAGETSPKGAVTAAGRRSKRDAPGTVMQSSQDGGAAVSVSKRRTKPVKPQKPTPKPAALVAATSPDVPQIRIDVDGRQEIVDPDEERYCVCGDVSWGEMICCEFDDKCDFGQWFHMECVGLVELPPRTVKWYCPGDRKKFHRGENSNGLVGRGIK
ncbi:hypothetical protein A1O3_00971 [Capronia epimyces CBS 606.96]|uniref:Inhibitor of growth protein N-terminal histone-binding domain-containing protein n=1 Tax=Capronia epimyces CBS 606.96 TaxID=1182542 RepID=W9YS02_9EURO|nr:uncharacterized protein A1O3_00971 [Capronia epimyces CBS 606.96]EXJ92420.1 hypothetical protein A1O3_00971 [Capronia epimyces CBS 606.96]